MTKKKQQDDPVKLFSLYGKDAVSVGSRMETYKQYRDARRLLLDKDILTVDELAVMSDADVEEVMDKFFTYVHSDDKTLVIVRRPDIPALEKLIIKLDK